MVETLLWSGYLKRVMPLAMRDEHGVASRLRLHELEQLGWTERRLKWGVYWLAEHRTSRGRVKCWGAIYERHTTTRSIEVSQFWRVSKNCGKDECRRLAKAVSDK